MLKKYFFLLAFCCAFNGHAQEYEVKQTLFGHQGGVQNIRFSPNGELLASCGKNDFQVLIWNSKTGKLLHRFKGHQDIVYEVTFNRQGTHVASASKDGSVRVWDVSTGKLVGHFENQPVITPSKITYKSVAFVCFSWDSKYVFFGGDNGYLCKGKLGKSELGAYYQSKRVIQTNTHNEHAIISITGGTITQDGKTVLVSIDHFVHAIDIDSEKIIKTFYYPFDYINDVVSGPKAHQISTWSYDGKVSIWDYKKGHVIKNIQVTAPKNYSVASFSSDGFLMVSGAFGNSARVWDWQSGKAIARLSAHKQIVRICRYSPKEDLIATASYDGSIKFWEPVIEEEAIVKEEDDEDEEEEVYYSAPANLPSFEPSNQLFLNDEPLEKGKLIELKNVQFEQGKYGLLEHAKKELKQVASLMSNNPTMCIEIHGHTDIQGHAVPNYALSKNRAMACKVFLVELGIYEKRIGIRAFGESKPIVTSNSETERKHNRRVEIKIIQL